MIARRPIGLALGGAAAITAVLTAAALAFDSSEVPDHLPLDAWAPYWVLDAAGPSAAAHGDVVRDVSPFWFSAVAPGTITTAAQADPARTAAFVDAARAAGSAVVPSIVDGMPAGQMAAVLADPATRTMHVDTIVRFASDGGYDGIDLDYESFAFADGRDTWESTRPNWVAFVTELAERLHSDGRTLTVSIPPVYDAGRTDDSGYWVYDHGAIAAVVDRIRVMAYDYSTSSAGPIAPLDWVQRAVDGTIDATGDPSKLVLGIPLYGYNWPVSTTGVCPPDQEEGRTSVTARTVADLVQRRGASPVYDPETAEWSFGYDLVLSDGATSCTQRRQVHYVEAQGARERIDLARRSGLGGVALWALGYEDEQTWTAIAPVISPVAPTVP